MKIDQKWVLRFMDLALLVSSWSKDPSCQVGTVIVSPDGRQISLGYNGLPRGMKDDEAILHDQEWKNALMVHAEVNALANCAVSPVGWTMVTTKFPCHECAKMIIQEGIACVVAPSWEHPDDKQSKWADSQELAEQLMEAVRIEIVLLDLHGC